MTADPRPSEAAYPAEFHPFWEGLRAGRISFPKCRSCGRTHWYPMKRCPHCLATEFDWLPVSGRGRLHSWTVVRRAFSADQADKVPYVVGLVEFDEVPGTRLITNIVGTDPQALAVDMPLEPVFADDGTAPPTVRFRPAPGRA
jgi:uncharacterized OB-fold protein